MPMRTDDDLNDSLDDLLGGPIVGPRPALPAHFTPRTAEAFVEKCPKCGGSGQTRWGVCFRCNGKGSKSFRSSPEKRAAGRARNEAKRIDKAREQQAWREEHKAEIAWLRAAADRQHEQAHKGGKVWDFPVSLDENLAQWGSLTDGQIAAIRRCMAKDAERAAERARDRQKAVDEAPAIDVTKIAQAFDRVRSDGREAGAEGVKWLKLHLGSFRFLDMPARGQWEAAILVTEGDVKLGKIVAGKFVRFRSCSDEQVAQIIAIAADPLAAAKAFGLKFSHCSCCGRELTNPESIALGIGPICAERWFCA